MQICLVHNIALVYRKLNEIKPLNYLLKDFNEVIKWKKQQKNNRSGSSQESIDFVHTSVLEQTKIAFSERS